MRKFLGLMSLSAVLFAAMSVAPAPSIASGGGGTGGGGSTKPVELRVTGYVTAIDYDNSLITVGASYYGTGTLIISSTTKITFDNVSCDLSDIEVGDWAEVRYDSLTKVATKLACSSFPTP